MDLSKSQIRSEARKIRAEKCKKENVPRGTFEAACDVFFSQIPLNGTEIIAGYWPSGSEFDGMPLLEKALSHGHNVVLPVIEEGSRVLSFRKWGAGDVLAVGAHGIRAPQDTPLFIPDIVIVPLLAFDRNGTRMGQGGGYYDATLRALRAQKDILALGLAYDAQAWLSELPCEAHDEKLDMVVTQTRVYDFRSQESL